MKPPFWRICFTFSKHQTIKSTYLTPRSIRWNDWVIWSPTTVILTSKETSIIAVNGYRVVMVLFAVFFFAPKNRQSSKRFSLTVLDVVVFGFNVWSIMGFRFTRWGFKYFYFHPGKWSNLSNMFQMGSNHQLVHRFFGGLELYVFSEHFSVSLWCANRTCCSPTFAIFLLVSDFSPLRLLFGGHSIQVSFLLGVLLKRDSREETNCGNSNHPISKMIYPPWN